MFFKKSLSLILLVLLLFALIVPMAGGFAYAGEMTGEESFQSQAGGPNPQTDAISANEPETEIPDPVTASFFSIQTTETDFPAATTSTEQLKVPDNALLIIDLSEWQNPEKINYDLLCRQISGVILRIGFTGYSSEKNKVTDQHFERHYAEFKKRGVEIGGYWFSRANSVEEAEDEAKATLQLLQGKEFELPVYWDTEDPYYQAKTGRQLLTDAGIAYMETVREAGYKVGIYACVNWYLNRLDINRLWEYHAENFFELWVAHYGVYSPQFKHNYWMWQFSNEGRLDGYGGYLDFNLRAKKGPDLLEKIDQTPPVITGLSDLELIQGMELNLKEGIRADDDKDGKNIPFDVSPRMIDTRQPGTHLITYSAKDLAGNVCSYTRTVTIKPTTFTDVPIAYWAYNFIENIYRQGLVQGYKGSEREFRPENNLTREQAATVIARAANLTTEGKEAFFPDVPADNPCYPFIAALADKGAINGFPDGLFRGRENIKRSHMAKILVLAFDLEMGSQKVYFSDMPQDPIFCEYIEILASNGIVSGYANTNEFRPNNRITRAEFSKMILLTQELTA